MRKMISWSLLLMVLVILGSGAVAFYSVFFRADGEVVIPPLRERSVVEAVAEAERLGFVVQIEPVASSLPEGRVLAQSPEPGTRARKKQVVVLQVSRSGDLRAVPDVRGQTLLRAQSVLREQGFVLGDVIRINDGGQPGGVVIAQSPAAPANISSAQKIDLLLREGGSGDENSVVVPDVNRKTEAEARSILAASGIKVQNIERVYSPLLAEGTAIETRPGAGTAVRPDEGVSLKIATQRRPSGYTEATAEPKSSEPKGAGTVRKATITPQEGAPAESTPTSTQRGSGVVVQVPGQGNVEIPNETPQAVQPAQPAQPSQPTQTVQQETAPAPAAAPAAGGAKKARIRYQAPPLGSPMELRIELADPSGKRDILRRQVKSMESISQEAAYDRECVVSIYLGGELVWQQKYR